MLQQSLHLPCQRLECCNVPHPSDGQRHPAMWGALLVRHWPGAGRASLSIEQQPQGLFLVWSAAMGLALLAAVLLWQQRAWHRLLQADPTGLTLVILAVLLCGSLWAGQRAWRLGLQWQALQDWQAHAGSAGPSGGVGGAEGAGGAGSWAAEHVQGRCRGGDASVLQQLLAEQAHGPHEMAWWFNGIQLKLGLLGKVIGFSMLALELGRMEAFDPQHSAQLLKSLTGGLGVALLTTLTGLAGNILLGLQLMRLDRFADLLVAQTLALGERQVHNGSERV